VGDTDEWIVEELENFSYVAFVQLECAIQCLLLKICQFESQLKAG
jgi:hypothetical protein